MKRSLTPWFIILLVWCACPLIAGDKIPHTSPIAFTENKGQVSDQYHRPRPDVLFSGTDGQLVYHLKKNGISYQLTQARNGEQMPKSRADRRQGITATRETAVDMHRVDITWLNCNPAAAIIKGRELEGYNNYYFDVCPHGALKVKSYRELTYHELYKGIDLHWITRDGNLKYEYTIAPGADYRELSWEIKGASAIEIDFDGNLVITTPLGVLVEERPLVLQDGKVLEAAWKLDGERISFYISGIDHSRAFVIDPLVRLWGTYYGGNDWDGSGYGTVDPSDNVFISGQTLSTSNIATTGSHQVSYGGTGTGHYPGDAIVVKFDPQGVRLWATYYGGSGCDFANGCASDQSGNLFFTGGTNTGNSQVMATPGCHQPTLAAYTPLGDALLVKLDASGARIWATYYGDIYGDIGLAVAAHQNGDVYVTGITESSTAANTVMATPGAHQPQHSASLAGNGDIFIARFSSSGARMWATYYGAEGYDAGIFCSTDLAGNIYVNGNTTSTTSAAMASPAAHQTVHGGNIDGLLLKFDGQGNRLWATYYGGFLDDITGNCAVDQHNNVYLAGATASTLHIATTGTHKPSFSFGREAYVAKFNSAGVRQFGTYYGGSGPEDWGSCAVDGAGNIYLIGITATFTSTDIATPCSYQPFYGGGYYDCFLAKFDTTGNRMWGTYFGGNGHECDPSTGYWPGVFVDAGDNVYIVGNVSQGTSSLVIADAGAHQQGFGGGTLDAFLTKFDGCRGIIPPDNSMLSVCPNRSATLTTVPNCATYWYIAPTGNNLLSIGSLNTQALSATTSFYASDAECGLGLPRTPVTVTVLPGPQISVTADRPKICEGESVTLTATGAGSYTWGFTPPASGTVTTLQPIFSSTYAVSGIGSNGCEGTFVFSVVLDPCTSMPENRTEQVISIYPNPSAGEFTVQSGADVTILLFNVLGQQVKNVELNSENLFTVRVEDLPRGIYFVKSATGKTIGGEKVVIR
jgi:hypothetical protein